MVIMALEEGLGALDHIPYLKLNLMMEKKVFGEFRTQLSYLTLGYLLYCSSKLQISIV